MNKLYKRKEIYQSKMTRNWTFLMEKRLKNFTKIKLIFIQLHSINFISWKKNYLNKECIRLAPINQANYDSQFYSAEGMRHTYDTLNKEYAKFQTLRFEQNLFRRTSSGSKSNLQRFQPYESNFESIFSKNNNKNKIFNQNSTLKFNGTECQDSRMNSTQTKNELKLPPLFVAKNS